MPDALYDQIGHTYTSTRHPDPRIAAAILAALGSAVTMVDVGAGAGAYEPIGRPLIGVEPSCQMIQQRSRGASPVIQAVAEALRRPETYLDPGVRASISGFALLDQGTVARGIAQLESDLKSGAWERRFGYLRSLDAIDAGYRLLATR